MSDIDDFIAAMRASGVDPAEPIAGKLASGKVIRFRCEGDGKKRNGWALFFPAERSDARAGGVFGNHKQNTGTIKWQADRQGPPVSAEELARRRAAWREEELRRARALAKLQDEAREEAIRIWRAAAPASPDHPYALKKRLRVGGLRQDGRALLVPMKDIHGQLWNLQRIYPDGMKLFQEGGRITGLCARIGMRSDFARAIFAEGFATGDAISQALGRTEGGNRPVIVAFNTANLGPVVGAWSRAFPRADWVIAADDDHLTGLKMVARGQPYQNPGLDKAEKVAAEFGCKVACPRRREGMNTDFSDLLLEGDEAGIVAAFEAARRKVDGAGPSVSLAERIGRAM